jgi:hypothetical protein
MLSIRRLVALVALACVAFSAAPARAQESRAASIHSPMTSAIVARLRAVLASARGAKDAFIKVGDSNTANPSFLSCFAGRDVELGEHASLEGTRRFFSTRRLDALHGAFDRISISASSGWITRQPLAGDPSPLVREIAAASPAFAVVMLGTNDNRPNGMDAFVEALPRVVDTLLARGVIPLLSTIPPRADAPAMRARVPELNRVIRALAASRQIPLMDLYSALISLPRHGLVADGIHLASAWQHGTPKPCHLTGDALQNGMNMRNLVTLQALDRARRFLVEGEAPESAVGA